MLLFYNFLNHKARFTFCKYIKISLLILLLIDLNYNLYRGINYVYAVKSLLDRIVRLITFKIN